MTTQVLSYMVAVAQEHSVSKAAERCYMTQSALSRHIKNVEDELGHTIFNRSHHPLALTPAGIVFIHNAMAILAQEEELKQKLELLRIAQRKKKIVTFFVDTTNLTYFLRLILPKFRAANPDVVTEVMHGNSTLGLQEVSGGKADIGFLCVNAKKELKQSLAHQEILTSRFQLVYPAGIPELTPEASRKEFLATHGSSLPIAVHPKGTTMRELFEGFLSELAVDPGCYFESPHFLATIEMLSNGDCAAILPESVTSKLPHQKVHVLNDIGSLYAMDCLVCRREDEAMLKLLPILLELMQEELTLGDYRDRHLASAIEAAHRNSADRI